MKPTVTIKPETYLGWSLKYVTEFQENKFQANHPDKPAIHGSSLEALMQAIEKREASLCRLKEPILVGIRSYGIPKRIDAEIFAFDEAHFYLRNEKGEVWTESLYNLENSQRNGGGSMSVRLRDERYPALLQEALKADAAAQRARQRQQRVKDAFTEVSVAAIKSAPHTKEASTL